MASTLGIVLVVLSLFWVAPISNAVEMTKQRQAEIKNLLLQDCGSCHGMTLKGGLGPALTPDVLQNKSRQMIATTIRICTTVGSII